MNLVPPMQPVAYNNIQKDLAKIYKTVANTLMIKAADELKETSSKLSCDSSWQMQGFSSLNGLVTVISVDSGKCLDFHVKTNNCGACSLWESRKGTDEYIHFIKKSRMFYKSRRLIWVNGIRRISGNFQEFRNVRWQLTAFLVIFFFRFYFFCEN